ncbi:MAG: phosphate ABC transporter permease subunit PstC [Candidatus Hydrogenedentes bacterium]|nr:phosphate ABC transporter permease subunit PstC [Candidatus Hydrogenedentota bacterium]
MSKTGSDAIIKALLLAASSASIFIVLLIFLFLIKESIPFFSDSAVTTLLTTRWMPVSFQKESFGIIPLVTGSLLVTGMASLLAVPAGVGCAIYIAELATPWEREFLKPIIEILAGIPSVVLGFFGLVVVVPMVQEIFHLHSGLNAVSGAIILALMALPTVTSISDDAIRSVPQAYKEASLALGASEITTILKVLVPAALPGIIAGAMLGVGRVVGETMAVLMVTGNAAQLSFSPMQSVRTVTATIAAEMGEVPFGSTHYHALFVLGAILMVSTFLLNAIALKASRRSRS